MQDTGVNFLTSVRPSLPKSKSCSTRPEITVKRLKSTLSDLFSSPRSKMKNAKSASLDPKSALFSPESALLDHKSTLPERGAQRTTTTELVLPDMSESPRIKFNKVARQIKCNNYEYKRDFSNRIHVKIMIVYNRNITYLREFVWQL